MYGLFLLFLHVFNLLKVRENQSTERNGWALLLATTQMFTFDVLRSYKF